MKKIMIVLLTFIFVGSQLFAGCGCGGGKVNNTKPKVPTHGKK